MVRGGHTQGGSRNTPLALLTGHPPSSPLPFPPSLSPTPLPHPPLPPLPLLLSLYQSPLTSQSSLSLSENSSSLSVRANLKLLSPPTIKNQAGCKKGRGRREVRLRFPIQYSRPKKRHTRVVVHLDQLKLCPPSMRGVDDGVRFNCHVCSLKERMDLLQPKVVGC